MFSNFEQMFGCWESVLTYVINVCKTYSVLTAFLKKFKREYKYKIKKEKESKADIIIQYSMSETEDSQDILYNQAYRRSQIKIII